MADPTLVARIARDFTYHRPPVEKQAAFKALRQKAKELALLIAEEVPSGREQATALTRLEECIMQANAGIARPFAVEE